MTHYDYLIGYVRENPRAYLTVVFLGALIGLIEFVGIATLLPAVATMLGEVQVGTPKLFAALLNSVGPTAIFIIYLTVVLLQSGISLAAEVYFIKVMAKWRTKLSLDYVRNILQADFLAARGLMPGETEMIITRNIGYAVRNRHRTAMFLTDIVLGFFYTLTALVVSPHGFILFALLGVIYGLLSKYLTGMRAEYSERANHSYKTSVQILSEHLQDFRGLQSLPKTALEDSVKFHLEDAGQAQKANDVINAGIRMSTQPIMFLLLAFGVVMSKMMFAVSNSQLLVMIYVFYRAAPKLVAIARGYGDIIQDSPVDLTAEITRWRRNRRPIPDHFEELSEHSGITFRDVFFSYSDKPVLRNVCMDVRPGELVALVGRSGSGKSTLLDLLCGFIRPEAGEIRAWGKDPAHIRYEDWLIPRVSLLRPESTVVSGSIASNIALLEKCPDRARISALLGQVGLDEIVGPQGLDTLISARGSNLSAGQRQRLLIARALYKLPTLLILDEPTSNLDSNTEHDINQLITSLKGSVTMVVVSHRRELLREADRIYRINGFTLFLETHMTTKTHQ